jgi:hypothetical protein
MATRNRGPWKKASFSVSPAGNILITTSSLGGSGASISLAIFIFRPNQVKYLDPDGRDGHYVAVKPHEPYDGNIDGILTPDGNTYKGYGKNKHMILM